MNSRGSRCFLAWVLAGDLLSGGQRAAELLRPRAIATTATTATSQLQRVRWVQLFVAGGETIRTRPTSSSTEGETTPDGALHVARAVARGREHLEAGSLHEAAEVLQAVLASKDDEPSALLHLAEVVAQLGQPLRAVVLADRLLGLEQLTPEAASFVLNRRGLYLQAADDWTGARESYELALERGWQGQGTNKHALWNLAALLHFHIFPSETAGPYFSALERAIELYQAALGRDRTSLQTRVDSNPSGSKSEIQDHEIGGPVDRNSIFRNLAGALLLAGRPGEAVAELEQALAELESEDDNNVLRKPMADRAAAAATRRISTALLWDSLSGARRAAGDVPGALAAGKLALTLVDNEPGLYHNMAVLLQKAGLLDEAKDAWLAAVALDSRFAPAFTGLGHLEGARGNIGRARQYYEASLAATRSPGQGDANENGGGFGYFCERSADEELTSMFLVATAVVPALYESNDHIAQVRRDFERGLDGLLAEPTSVSPRGLERPAFTVGSGALGYYIIYQGFDDLQIRRKLAQTYWKFAPSLRYCAPFLDDGNICSTEGHHQRNEAGEAINRGSSSLGNPVGHSSDLKHGDAATGDTGSTLSHTMAAPNPPPPPTNTATTKRRPNAQDLLDTASHDPGSKEVGISSSDTLRPCRRRRIKVGFLSAFFFHHSVGLLMEGVVTRLDRRRFETTSIFLQPHPTATSTAPPGRGAEDRKLAEGDGGGFGDDVYNTVRTGTEHVLDVPMDSLVACHHAIASLQLDVLVFTEIGMNAEAYFLSFARLARRSVLFWGHAVTSGVSAFDALHSGHRVTGDQAHPTGEGDGMGHASSGEIGLELGDAEPGPKGGDSTYPLQAGGIDYFVSSWLFEDKILGRVAQRKYSERLYLMEGLTTRFTRPAPPELALVTRETLGIPLRPPQPRDVRHPSDFPTPVNTGKVAAADDGGLQDDDIAGRPVLDGGWRSRPPSCGALYLVPQTLYKLHPDFDRLVAGVLTADPSGCAVFIKALEASVTEALVQRMSRALLAAGVAAERAIFVPRMSLSEFSGLVQLANVVLDPFPVGGGRSSFEILAVGTPIVMLYNRTSILQLTYGMYAIMGLEGAIGNATDSSDSVSLVTYSEDGFIRSAVAIATDLDLSARTRELILANNHRNAILGICDWKNVHSQTLSLFEQDSVVAEWEIFLEGIISVPRPPPTERNLGLAVDASDFPRNIPWCRHSDSNTEADRGEDPTDSAEGDANAQPHEERSTVHPQTSYVDANAPRHGLRQDQGAPPPPEAGSYPGGNKTSQEGFHVATSRSNRRATTDPDADTTTREWAAMPLASSSAAAGAERGAEAGVIAGGGGQSGGDGIFIGPEPELLYAVIFMVAPPHEGDEPMKLSAEVYEGMKPMEEASRLRREGALDYLQFRWIGAVLCRGVERLKRPVVWSTYVKVDGGPRALLEVRHGDELYQVARWHCQRHNLGLERVPALSTRLERELPQHTDPEWVSARAEDRSCSISPGPAMSLHSPSSPTTPDHAGDRPISVGSGKSTLRPSTKQLSVVSGGSAAVGGTTDGRHGRENSVGDDEDANPRHGSDGEGDDGGGCVTLAITTCKRLRAFLGTAEGLQALLGPLPQGLASAGGEALPRVCQVLVVDDGSSPKDRGVMLSSFPRFTYVFKGPEDEKGHAGSMNIILSMTKTRYLLYIEDDWWAVHDNPLPPRSVVGNFLWRAMEVLTKSTERVSQVLVNDQSTRNCAWGDTATCTPEIRGKSAGWPRFTVSSLSGQERGQWPEGHSNFTATYGEGCPSGGVGGTGYCGSSGQPISSSEYDINDGHPPVQGDDSDTNVEYRLHEFGLLSPLHAFAHWPGFSLNPALWDLERLDASYRKKYGRQFTFDPANIRFEQSMSVELLDAGVAVAHLPDVTFRHVGAGQSAYEANDMRRPWD